ncbi:MAG: hypothetical protein KatS3mg115_1765 [Candidatus Poribacteria bacterium]|nr:MAG: hypothetical protein KatS3mg115_1765 [Candidatus Poribacteria bacterium]
MPSVESVGPIVRVESVVLRGTRPRVIGRNARLPVHGQFARDRIVRLITADGLEGWGWSVATDEEARQLLGKRPAELFQLPEGTKTPFLSFDFPLWDLVGQALGQPVWKLLGDGGPHPVPVYDGSIYIDEIDPETGQDKGLQPILDAVQTGLEAGFWAFKVKVGRGVPLDGEGRRPQARHRGDPRRPREDRTRANPSD